MSLSNSLRPSGAQALRLLQLSSIPTTEDLRYLMGEAKKAMRPVIMPFRKDQDGQSFSIQFTLPNLWEFYKVEASGPVQVWVKESLDVLMVQNKVKISTQTVPGHSEPPPYQGESASYEDTEPLPEPVFNQPTTFNSTGIPNFLSNLDAGTSPKPSEIKLPSFLGNWGDDSNSLEQPQATAIGSANQFADGAVAVPEAPVAPQTEQINQETAPHLVTNNRAAALVTETTGELLPFELDPYACGDVMNRLADPASGQTHFRAFTFFLIRESIRCKTMGTSMAVVVFDFCDKETGDRLDFSAQGLDLIASLLFRLCSVLHISARLDSGEFAVLLCDGTLKTAIGFSETLRAEMLADESLSELCQASSCSIGIAVVSDTLKEPSMLLAAARRAKNIARVRAQPYNVYS